MVDDTCNRETEAKRDIGSEREERGWEGKRMGGEGEEEREKEMYIMTVNHLRSGAVLG